MNEKTMSLPMASDTARSEASFITDAAKRVAEQLALVEAAAQDGQSRIRATQHYVEDLDRHGSIDHGAALEILRHLLRPDERSWMPDNRTGAATGDAGNCPKI